VAAAIAAAVVAIGLVGFFTVRAPVQPPAAAALAVLADAERKAPPRTVTVVLKTEPAGAAIAERGALLGTSPHVWSATAGEHQLTFQLAGYRDATQDLVTNADGQEFLVRLAPVRSVQRRVKDPAIKAER
jgi:hypothetical protein